MRLSISRPSSWAFLGAAYVLLTGILGASDTFTVAAGHTVTVQMPITAFGQSVDFGSGLYNLQAAISNDDTGGFTTFSTNNTNWTYSASLHQYTYTTPTVTQGNNFHLIAYAVISNGGGTQLGKYYAGWFSAKDNTVYSNPSTSEPQHEDSGLYTGGTNNGTGTSGDYGLTDVAGNLVDQYGNSTFAGYYKTPQVTVTNTSAVPQVYNIHYAPSDGSAALTDTQFTLQPGETKYVSSVYTVPGQQSITHLPAQQLDSNTTTDPQTATIDATTNTSAYQGATPTTPVQITATEGTTTPATATAPTALSQTGTATTGASQADITNLDKDTRNGVSALQTQLAGAQSQAHQDANNIVGAIQTSAKGSTSGSGSGTTGTGTGPGTVVGDLQGGQDQTTGLGTNAPTQDGTLGTGVFAAMQAIPGKLQTVANDLTNLANKTIPQTGGGSSSWNFNFPIAGNSYAINVDQVSWFFPWIRGITLAIAIFMFARSVISLVKAGFATAS